MPASNTRYAYWYNALGRLMPEAFTDHNERSAWLAEDTKRWPIRRRDLSRQKIKEALYWKNLMIGEEQIKKPAKAGNTREGDA